MWSRSWIAVGMQENHCEPSHAQGLFAQCKLVPFLPRGDVLHPHGSVCSVKMPGAKRSAPGSPWHCRAELGQGLNQS